MAHQDVEVVARWIMQLVPQSIWTARLFRKERDGLRNNFSPPPCSGRWDNSPRSPIVLNGHAGKPFGWPAHVARNSLPPWKLRLVKVQGKQGSVWLMTSVLSHQRLSDAVIGEIYCQR